MDNMDKKTSRRARRSDKYNDPRLQFGIPEFIPNPEYTSAPEPEPTPSKVTASVSEPKPEPEWEIVEEREVLPIPEEPEIEWELAEEPEPEPEDEEPDTTTEEPDEAKSGKKGLWIALIAIVAVGAIFGVVSLVGAIFGSGTNSLDNQRSQAVSWAQNDSFRTLAPTAATQGPTTAPISVPAEQPTPEITTNSIPTAVYGRTTMKRVNVREEPRTDSKRVTALPKERTAVTIISVTTNTVGEKWYKVELSNGLTGYVQADYLTVEGSAVIPEE